MQKMAQVRVRVCVTVRSGLSGQDFQPGKGVQGFWASKAFLGKQSLGAVLALNYVHIFLLFAHFLP